MLKKVSQIVIPRTFLSFVCFIVVFQIDPCPSLQLFNVDSVSPEETHEKRVAQAEELAKFEALTQQARTRYPFLPTLQPNPPPTVLPKPVTCLKTA